MALSGVISFQFGLILLCLCAVVYISFTAYEMDLTKKIRNGFVFRDYNDQQLNCSCDQLTKPSKPTKPPTLIQIISPNTTSVDTVYQAKEKQNSSYSDQRVTMISNEFFQYLASQLRGTPFPGVESYTDYTVAHAKLKPLPNIKPLKPEFGPVLNDVTYFKYPFKIQPCRKTGGLFLAVISAPDYFDKRQIIRQTWLRHMFMQSDLGALNLSGFGFVVGLTRNNETQTQIEEESAKYNDILQIDMMDDYYNLTLKVVGLTNWLHNHCSQVDFVLKVDDDVYVNVHNLLTVLGTLNATEQSVYGSVTVAGPMREEGKWNITYEDWPWGEYPRYLRGAAVLMPGKTIGPLLAASQTTPYFPFDDVYLTGLCTSKAGINVLHSYSLFVGAAPETPDACTVLYSVTWLTESVDHLNKSHWATEDFYRNVTECLPDGTDWAMMDPNEITKFSFSSS